MFDDRLRIDVRQEQDRAILALSGEFDLVGVPALQREIETAETGAAKAIVLDLEELQFMDSTGLRAILSARERAQERGQEFAVTQGSSQVQRLLSVTRVGDHLKIIASPDETLV
ncbi:MAG TPA: STAS domain-containing protein [Solirubrobacteraceae bacterium]|jgi:anti-anti-sigma factor